MSRHNVLLPLDCPDTVALRKAVSAIIRDVQHAHHETDQQTADKLGVHFNTIANARNEKADLGSLAIAKIGFHYGAESVQPFYALYGATGHSTMGLEDNPLPALSKAVAALCDISSHKDRFDALPVLKAAGAALDAYVCGIEAQRLRV